MALRTADLTDDIGEVLLSEDQIAAKVAELGARIGADYADRQLTLVSVLKGSLPFMADLMRDRKSTRLNSSHVRLSRMPSSA